MAGAHDPCGIESDGEPYMARILLIEDDPNSARLVMRVLEKECHVIIHASEGLTGLKLASQDRVDLVLLDVGLPDISGHTIAALMNRIPGNPPVVAVTASIDEASERRAKAYGRDGYITKPIDTRAFPGQVAAFLERDEAASEEPAAEDAAPTS